MYFGVYKDNVLGCNSGDTDGRVPVLSTRYSLSSLGLPITRAWRPWYHQKQVILLILALNLNKDKMHLNVKKFGLKCILPFE